MSMSISIYISQRGIIVKTSNAQYATVRTKEKTVRVGKFTRFRVKARVRVRVRDMVIVRDSG